MTVPSLQELQRTSIQSHCIGRGQHESDAVLDGTSTRTDAAQPARACCGMACRNWQTVDSHMQTADQARQEESESTMSGARQLARVQIVPWFRVQQTVALVACTASAKAFAGCHDSAMSGWMAGSELPSAWAEKASRQQRATVVSHRPRKPGMPSRNHALLKALTGLTQCWQHMA